MPPAPDLRPPDQLAAHAGYGDFTVVGRHLLGLLLGEGLKPEHDVLDVGCGVGRLAVPLTGYLRPSSRYEGFDVMAQEIEWCRANVSPAHPNFRFVHVDLFNGVYNAGGSQAASDFAFPYRDASFDLAVAFSVFTHLLPEDMARYAAEAARVLRPGGTLCATFFLINSDVLAREGAWESRFDRDFGAYRVLENEPQERALAYDEHHVRKVMRGCGFSVKGVRWGTWSGVADGPTYQDLLVARATGGHGLGRLVRRRRGRP